MSNYPNKDALYKAHDIYRDAMRKFISSTSSEELINITLGREPVDDIRALIDIGNIPYLLRRLWNDVFDELFNYTGAMDIRSAAGVIRDGRNKSWAHPGMEDVAIEFTRTHLFLIADLLSEINEMEEKDKVEKIREQLCADDTAERLEKLEKEKARLAKRLELAEVEKAELKERLSEKEDRLKTVDSESAERIKTLSEQLTDNATKLETKEETLSTLSEQLRTVKAERDGLEKRLKNLLKQPETLKTEYEERLQTALKQLKATNAVKAELEERLETTSTRLEDVEAELKVVKSEKVEREKRLPEVIPKPLPLNTNMPDSITFHGTTFTKHFDQYYVEGDDITQTFWNYWHSQGSDGKQKMRDAGWSVEKVNDDWEVTISPEDFQAWIETEVTELSNLLDSSQNEEPSTQSTRSFYGRTVLPTGKDMEQPALEFLSDGREYPRIEIINVLTEHFSLTKNQREQLSRSGRMELYLGNKDLIERTRKGYYRITDRGLEVLRQNSDDVPF